MKISNIKSHQLERILNNKTLGSSELVQQLNNYFLSIHNNKTAILRDIKSAKTKLRQFETVNSYLRNLSSELKTGHSILNYLRNYSIHQEESFQIIFNKLSPRLKKLNSIITLSRSGTVLEFLKYWHKKNKQIKVFICESRPKLEGRLMAESLALAGIKSELITDAMMGIYISKIDAAMIGADTILKNGNVVNKVGSKSLALLCKEYKKPFYVVTTRSKFSSSKKFNLKLEDPNEIYNKKVKNLSISNIYFEEVEKRIITKIITD